MADDTPPLIVPSTGDAAQRSLVEDVRQLASDGRTLLEAELSFQKSRAAVAGQGAKGVAAWGALALALVFFALMSLVLGLLLIVTIYAGPVAATVTVTLGVLLAAGGAGWIAKRRWDHAASLLSEPAEASDV
jgi:hypothetical protein